MIRIIMPGDIKMSFQPVPAGEFLMGSRAFYDDEEPVHLVRITKPFYLGTFPVTQEQFAAFRPEHEDEFADRPNHPAENMTWHDAVAFCDRLTVTCADSMPRDHVAVLPSEAQWEYACRAGTETEYYSGDGEAALAEVGWYYSNSEDSTQPVGRLKPNAFGLYDMHGNVGNGVGMLGMATPTSAALTVCAIRLPTATMKQAGWSVAGLGTASPGAAAPRVATGGGRRSATGSKASGSAWSPVRAQPVRERSREAEARQGGTTQPSRSVTAKRPRIYHSILHAPWRSCSF